MKIVGFQKTTLLDYPQKIAATVFTGGCNMRCPFCHNPELIHTNQKSILSEEEFFEFIARRKKFLDAICISGGEPTQQPDLEEFIVRIKSMGYLVKLDTNGSAPSRLRSMIDEKLIDYVAMDIKNSPQKYSMTMGVKSSKLLEEIQKSVKILLESSIPYEFRTTVVKEFHESQDFYEIGKWIEGARAYYLQNFEDNGKVLQSGLHPVSQEELIAFKDIALQYVNTVEIRGI